MLRRILVSSISIIRGCPVESTLEPGTCGVFPLHAEPLSAVGMNFQRHRLRRLAEMPTTWFSRGAEARVREPD
jgi:hypothetical protein